MNSTCHMVLMYTSPVNDPPIACPGLRSRSFVNQIVRRFLASVDWRKYCRERRYLQLAQLLSNSFLVPRTPRTSRPTKHLHLKYDWLIGVPYVPRNHISPTARSVFPAGSRILSIGTIYTLRERTVPSSEELDQE